MLEALAVEEGLALEEGLRAEVEEGVHILDVGTQQCAVVVVAGTLQRNTVLEEMGMCRMETESLLITLVHNRRAITRWNY